MYGCGTGLLGLGLLWSLWLPILRLLWTSSFVPVAGGLSFLMMATFCLIIDVLGYTKWVRFADRRVAEAEKLIEKAAKLRQSLDELRDLLPESPFQTSNSTTHK